MVSKHPINQTPALMQHLQIKPSSVPLLYFYDVIIWNIWYNGMHSLLSLPKIGFIWSCLSFKANPEQCVLLVLQYSVLYMCLTLKLCFLFHCSLITHFFASSLGLTGLTTMLKMLIGRRQSQWTLYLSVKWHPVGLQIEQVSLQVCFVLHDKCQC